MAITLVGAALWVMHDTRTPVHSVSVHPYASLTPDNTPRPMPAWTEQPAPASTTPVPSEESQAARANTLSLWAEKDPRAAFLYLKKHDGGRADVHLMLAAFRQWACVDFSAAFDEAEQHPAGLAREELFGALALIVAQASPAEAAAMTERDMGPGPVRTETALSILHHWALADIEQAIVWAATFPRGPERERAIRELEGLSVSFFPRATRTAP